jgi:hypothetical protein
LVEIEMLVVATITQSAVDAHDTFAGDSPAPNPKLVAGVQLAAGEAGFVERTPVTKGDEPTPMQSASP